MANAHREINSIDGRTNDDFEPIPNITFQPGSFGKVIAVKDKHGQSFALKKIWYTDPVMMETVFKEIEIMSSLNAQSIVKFYCAWIEDNEFIFIQMELCKDNLKNVIRIKPELFGRESKKDMGELEYFVSWHIMDQIAHGVLYLHSRKPKRIIHRDLKPANVLFSEGQNGKAKIKLCDFGLSVTHESKKSNHTASQGTDKYMAPEVKQGGQTCNYNEKADVYSLAIIALEVFGKAIGDNVKNRYRTFKSKDAKFLLTNPEFKVKPKQFYHAYFRNDWIEWFEALSDVYSANYLNNNFWDIIVYIKSCIVVPPENYHDRDGCQDFIGKMKEWINDDMRNQHGGSLDSVILRLINGQQISN